MFDSDGQSVEVCLFSSMRSTSRVTNCVLIKCVKPLKGQLKAFYSVTYGTV